jgi:hypothetical protein
MKNQITIALILTTALSTYGQVSKTELLGKWICENNDSAYHKNKHITFYSDSAFKDRSSQCNFVEWTIETDRFFMTLLNKCLNDGQVRGSMSLLKDRIDLRKAGRKRIIELVRGDQVYDRFKVVEFGQQRVDNNSRTIKVLKLKRL